MFWITKSSLRKLRLSFQLYSFLSELSSKLPLMIDSQQYVFFFFSLVCTSKLFQPFLNTQFQSLFHGICYNNIPTFCLSFCFRSFRLLKQNKTKIINKTNIQTNKSIDWLRGGVGIPWIQLLPQEHQNHNYSHRKKRSLSNLKTSRKDFFS